MSTATEVLTGGYAADPVHSYFGFTLKHMKVASFTARFDDVQARVVSDEQGMSLDGTVGVESISIRTPQEFRDHVVYSEEFFDAKTYPQIAFHSTDIDLAADGTATVRGELTIKDVTRPFVATGTYQPAVEDPFGGTRLAAELAATVDRRDWGLNWQAPMPRGGDVLGWDVTLTVHVELVKES